MHAPIVISLGGSLIAPPGGVDVSFLKKFRALILRHVGRDRRFVIICGGGTTARLYQKAADKVTTLTRDDLDWIGIHATRLNGHLMRTIFRSQAHPKIVTDPHEEMDVGRPILIGAGWRPGCSTDFDAVLLAKRYGAKRLINLSNITYVYDKDPAKHKDAKALPQMTWKSFRKQFGSTWHPGLNSPFDPVASKEAERIGLSVVIADGTDLANLGKILDQKKFKGTIIR